MLRYFWTIFSLFIVDRLSKLYILKKSSSLEGDFLQVYLNQDIAFSIPVPNLILWPLLIVIIVFLAFWFYQAYEKKEIIIWPLGLLLIGAVSNLLDRLFYGGVIDFIKLAFFPVFNLSDVYITIAVIWLFVWQWQKK